MFKKIAKIVGIAMIALIMSGCDEAFINSLASDQPNSVHGGIASAPAQLSLDLNNVIEENAYFNYFKYEAVEGERLTIDAVLEYAILSSQRTECQEDGETFIALYDSGMNKLDSIRTCTKHLTIEFPADDTYIIQILYPGNKGYFTAESSES